MDRMTREERIEFAHWLLQRVDIDRHNPVIGNLMAARWATGAFAHALMAYSGMDNIETEIPASMYTAAIRMDREAGGGERWRQAAFAAYELSHHFYLSGLPPEEADRKLITVIQATEKLLERLEPSGQETPF